jgi:predicted phage tail protein
LAQWLLDREAEGMAFRVTRGRDKITNEAPEGLVLPWSEREVFSIAPVIVGAGRGVGTILAGIALIALSFGAATLIAGAALSGALSGTALQIAAFAANAGITMGAGLVLGGIAQLISPMPSMGSFTSGKEAARLESFSFSSIVNTSQSKAWQFRFAMAVPSLALL